MTVDDAAKLLRESLLLVLVVASPMLIIGLVVGVVISLVQAVTQIQEQSLAFVPKIAAMFLAAVVLMPWIGTKLLDHTRHVFETLGPWTR